MANVAAVLLAAGASARFGPENKLVARIGGRPLVRCVAEAVASSGVSEIVAVTGADAALIEGALDGLPVRFAHNATWQDGMGTSIAAGVSALGESADGAFIVPGDMPLLTTDLLQSLIAAFDRHGGGPIVYPATPDGEQRNPVLWPRRFFPKLRALSGPEGGKALLRTLAVETVAVPCDPAAFADVDTPAELRQVAERLDAAAHKSGT